MSAGSLLTRLPTHERRLDNGLTVLVREDRSAPVVAIVTHVKAGYFNEPDRVVGISHVLEHMYFKGTARRAVGEIARETKAAGGYLNAGTIYDYTSYYTVLPSSALEQGLDIQSDALRNSEVDEEELRKELLVIIQEAKRKLDNPGAVAMETLYEEMFDVHRIRRWRIGTEEGLRRLTRADVWEYYRNLYLPSNIVLVIAGDVDPDRTFDLVDRYYGDMPGGEPVGERSPEEPPRVGFRFRELAGDIVQTHMEWGWRSPGALHEDTARLDLLAIVLGQGRASRLYRGVRDAGRVSTIAAYNYTPTEIGVFGISAKLLPEDTRGAVEAVWRELDAVRREGLLPSELERARNILEARVLRRLETVEGQANLLAEWQALGDWRLAGEYLDRAMAVDRDALVRVAEEYLALDRATVLVYRPAGAPALGWSSAGLEEILGDVAGPPAGRPTERPAEPPASSAPAAWTPTAREDDVHFYDVADGVRVAIRPRRSSLVAMGIFTRGGVLREAADTAGLTSLVARTAIKGTARMDAARIAEETEMLGGAIVPAVTMDAIQFTLTLPGRHLRRGFELLADVALRANFPEAELERERKVALADLDQVRDDMYRYPLRLFLQAAFAGHPYGLTMADTESTLRAASRTAVQDWHLESMLGGEPWVLMVGDVEPDTAAATIAAAFDGRSPARPGEVADSARWPEGVRTEAEQRAKAQTALVLGFPGPARDDPELFVGRILGHVMSGLGGRLFEELRGRRSLAYTVAAYPIAWWRGGAFVAYIATSPEREDEARRGLIEEFERVAAHGITPEELERAQNYAVGQWKVRRQTNAAQLADLAGALLLGDGLAELREFEPRIRAVTAEDVRSFVERHFDPNRLVEGIVRGTGSGR